MKAKKSTKSTKTTKVLSKSDPRAGSEVAFVIYVNGTRKYTFPNVESAKTKALSLEKVKTIKIVKSTEKSLYTWRS
jgi:hypothetical protein